jgi:hypothetical protein
MIRQALDDCMRQGGQLPGTKPGKTMAGPARMSDAAAALAGVGLAAGFIALCRLITSNKAVPRQAPAPKATPPPAGQPPATRAPPTIRPFNVKPPMTGGVQVPREWWYL